jgi:hypothetical protein
MNKLLLGAAVSASLFAGIASAATSYNVFISGASASRVFLEKYLTDATLPSANRVCKVPATIARDSAKNNQNRYTCPANVPGNAALTAGGVKAGDTLVIYKRSAGGSIYGVNPIVLDAPVGFLGNVNAKPDLGVSDVAPLNFVPTKGNFISPPGTGWTPITPAGNLKLAISPIFVQTFGIVVNNKLKARMGLVGGVPNLTSTQVASVFKNGKYLAGGSLPTLPAGQKLLLCTRTAGSGTKAVTANAFGLGIPNTANTATVTVQQNASQGDMETCLASAPGWAMGISGTENNASATDATRLKPYSFVRINGVLPTLANVFTNVYKDWGVSTCQYNKTHFPVNAVGKAIKAIAIEVCKEMGNPRTVGNLDFPDARHYWGQSGFMALSTLWTPPFPKTPNLPFPVK